MAAIWLSINILGMSSSQLTNSIIFQRGWYTTNQASFMFARTALIPCIRHLLCFRFQSGWLGSSDRTFPQKIMEMHSLHEFTTILMGSYCSLSLGITIISGVRVIFLMCLSGNAVSCSFDEMGRQPEDGSNGEFVSHRLWRKTVAYNL